MSLTGHDLKKASRRSAESREQFKSPRIRQLRPRRQLFHGRLPKANVPRCRPDRDWLRPESSFARRAGLPRTDPDRSSWLRFPRLARSPRIPGKRCAFAKRVLQVDGNAVLLEKIG